MTITELLSIKMVAETGSLASAAERLYMGRSSLSALVSRVEADLGTTLFKRTSSGVALTNAGKEYLRTANVILKSYTELKDNINAINHLERGTVALGASDYAYRFFLTPLLKSFHSRYPNLHVTVNDNAAKLMEERLTEGELDLVITHLPLETPGLTQEIICFEPLILVLPKGHPVEQFSETDPERGIRRIDIHHLENETMVLPGKYYRDRRVMDSALESSKVTLKACIELRRYETILAYAAAYNIATMGPYSVMKALQIPADTNCYYIKGYEEAYRLAVAYVSDTPLPPATSALKDTILRVIPALYTNISCPDSDNFKT